MRISDWSSDVCSSDLYTADSEVSGKNVGTDLAEGKPTLPLIHAMKHGSKDETALIRDAIMHGRVEQLEAVLKAVESTGRFLKLAPSLKGTASKLSNRSVVLPTPHNKKHRFTWRWAEPRRRKKGGKSGR